MDCAYCLSEFSSAANVIQVFFTDRSPELLYPGADGIAKLRELIKKPTMKEVQVNHQVVKTMKATTFLDGTALCDFHLLYVMATDRKRLM